VEKAGVESALRMDLLHENRIADNRENDSWNTDNDEQEKWWVPCFGRSELLFGLLASCFWNDHEVAPLIDEQ